MQHAGIDDNQIYFNRNTIPDELPGGFKLGIISLAIETGKDGTRTRYLSSDLNFEVYLVVDADKDIADPEANLYQLKESFREKYQELIKKDIQRIEYYPSYVKGSYPVMIAKFSTITEKN